MRSHRGFAIAAAVALAFSVACGQAPDGSEAGGGGADGFGDDAGQTPAERTGTAATGGLSATLSEGDRLFVQKANAANEMEVTLGELAEDKAERAEVKQFGEQLARDHEAANRELQDIVGDVTTAQEAPEVEQVRKEGESLEQRLEELSGREFDRVYLEEMVKHHQQDIQEFERAAKSSNEELRAFAEKTLPTLRQHLERAQQLQKQTTATR